MTARLVVDTNVFVYAYDRSEPGKQRTVLTTQILAEFFRAVTRRITAPIPVAAGLAAVADILGSWRVVAVPPRAVAEAARGVRDHRLPFWDALVWASARLAGITLVLTEDLPGAFSIEGVAYQDPFAAGFRLDAR